MLAQFNVTCMTRLCHIIFVVAFTAHSNPLLSSVSAQNKSYLSVQITWRLTDHGVFTSAIVSLRLRLLNSSDWSHVIANISHDHGLHKFDCLQPGSMYLLNISLYNRYKQTENRALVFWSAATNSSGKRLLTSCSRLVKAGGNCPVFNVISPIATKYTKFDKKIL